MASRITVSKRRIDALLVSAIYDDQLDEDEKKNLLHMGVVSRSLPEGELVDDVMGMTFLMLTKVYLAKRNLPARQEESTRVLDGFTKDDDTAGGNHLFLDLWLPWAQKAMFVSSNDCFLIASDYGAEAERLRDDQVKTSWAIPTTPVLKYMVENAPAKKITELGAGRGYWTKLLRKNGADIVAVDDISDRASSRSLIRDMIRMDARKYVQQKKADDTALFFCWPRMKESGGAWVESCLADYKGDTIFYVGELDRGCTFEIDRWLEDIGKSQGWRAVHQQVMPAFCGIRDEFLHLKKEPVDPLTSELSVLQLTD